MAKKDAAKRAANIAEHRRKWRERRAAKAERLNARQEAAAKRTPQEQLKRLDMMFGKGKGATKERAKLAARINKAKEKST